MGIYIKPIIRDDKPIKRNGKYPIYFYISFQGTETKIPSKLDIEKQFWNKEKGRAKSNFELATQINTFLEVKINLVQAYFIKTKIMEQDVNDQKIKLLMKEALNEHSLNQKNGDANFYQFYEEQIVLWEGVKKESTLTLYKETLSVLKQFRPQVTFKDINLQFVESLNHYLLNTRKNTFGGAENKHKHLKAVIRSAKKKGLIEHYAYEHFSIRRSQPRQIFLDIKELKQLEDLEIPSEMTGVRKYRDLFVLCCYTGLRYSDLRNLRKENLINNSLSFSMEKTKKPVVIPLSLKAKAIIEEYKDHIDNKADYLLPVPCYGRVRHLLYKLNKIYPVNKNLTTHVARHTFASLAVHHNINLKVIQDLMGHSNISQTAQYAKTTSEQLKNAIEKFDI